MMRHSDFCVLIISHGRAGRVKTLNALERFGYSGPWYIIIDNEDSQAGDYLNCYGSDHVVVFDKPLEASRLDIADNFTGRLGRKSTVYVRNASFDIARRLGFRYFMVLDDDYDYFRFVLDSNRRYTCRRCTCLDTILDICLDYFTRTPALATIAWLQGGDLLGGANSNSLFSIRRKAMNSFICDTERPFSFMGRFNEDVNTYITHGNRGVVMFSITELALNQASTQQTTGGVTEAYQENGTCVKSFYSVMHMPSAVKIRTMGEHYRRIHHAITWNNCVPKIIRPEYRKPDIVRGDRRKRGRSRKKLLAIPAP